MEIQSNKHYYEDVLKITAILFGAMLLTYFFTNASFIFCFSFFLIIELLYFSRKFIDSVIYSNGTLAITYYQFFSKKIIQLPLASLSMQVKKQVTFRGGAYHVLEVKQKGKVVIIIDERDGFELKDLEVIKNFKDGVL